jgi:hypothetical protein
MFRRHMARLRQERIVNGSGNEASVVHEFDLSGFSGGTFRGLENPASSSGGSSDETGNSLCQDEKNLA